MRPLDRVQKPDVKFKLDTINQNRYVATESYLENETLFIDDPERVHDRTNSPITQGWQSSV